MDLDGFRAAPDRARTMRRGASRRSQKSVTEPGMEVAAAARGVVRTAAGVRRVVKSRLPGESAAFGEEMNVRPGKDGGRFTGT